MQYYKLYHAKRKHGTPRWLKELWGYHAKCYKPVTLPTYKFMEKDIDKEDETP